MTFCFRLRSFSMAEPSDQEIIADLKATRDRRRQHRPKAAQVLPPPSAPMAVARQFVEHCCLHDGAADHLTLRFWHGGWWSWRTTHWAEVEERTVRALLYAFAEHAVYVEGHRVQAVAADAPQDWRSAGSLERACHPGRATLNNPLGLMAATSQVRLLPSPMAYLISPAERCIRIRRFSSTRRAVPFDYDSAAPPPLKVACLP